MGKCTAKARCGVCVCEAVVWWCACSVRAARGVWCAW